MAVAGADISTERMNKERAGQVQAGETRGLIIALTSYAIMVIALLGTYWVTRILSLLAQGLDMLSDVLMSGFLLLSLYWSRRPADEFHMFGHGRAQNVAALVASVVLIAFMSLETLRGAIPKFFNPPGAGDFQHIYLAFIIVLVSVLVVAVPLLGIMRVKEKGASARAQLTALAQDEFANFIVLFSLVLISQGIYIADAIASVIIAILIALSGIYLFRANVHYLVGRTPGQELLYKIVTTALSVNGVLDVHELKAEYVGPDRIHAGFHIAVAPGTPIEEADRIAHEVQRRVSQENACQYCVVHVGPKHNDRP